MRDCFRATLALGAFALFIPRVAPASGFHFGENGARALGQGGAFVALADDATAIQHNPAGLAQIAGLHFLIDGAVLNHDVAFQRVDGQTAIARKVRNQAGPFLLPFLATSYRTVLSGRPLVVALGVYAPPSIGRYEYPEPNYTNVPNGSRDRTYEANPIVYAPQRYGIIRSDSVILFPTAAVAFEPHPAVRLGVSLQYVYARLEFRQAVTSVFYTPRTMLEEDPAFDSIIAVEEHGRPAFTGIAGLLVRPFPSVHLGLSYRPPVPLDLAGKAEIILGETSSLATVTGTGQARFSLTLPQELKIGARYQPTRELGLDAELVYQGWQSIQELVFVPEDIAISVGNSAPRPLEPIRIPKRWHHAWALRAGASWRFASSLIVRTGVMLEQGAIPDERLHIDFLHFARAFVTAGVEYTRGPWTAVLSGALLPGQTREIRSSEVRQTNTDVTRDGAVIGNGTYTSAGWIAALGVRTTFGGAAH
jgi:long-chain fatty acid transport protein